jgi:hypothetical protein
VNVENEIGARTRQKNTLAGRVLTASGVVLIAAAAAAWEGVFPLSTSSQATLSLVCGLAGAADLVLAVWFLR